MTTATTANPANQGLSEAEIALLDGLDEDGMPIEDGAPAKASKAAPTDDSDPGDEPEAANEDAPVVDAEAPAEPVANAAEASADAEDDAPVAQSAFVPQYSAEVPADAAAQIAALRAQERAAFKKLMAGDNDMDEEAYEAIRGPIDEKIDELKTKVLTASIFQQANEQAATQRAKEEWESAKAQCFTQFKAEGMDYENTAKPGLLAAYNHHLKALGANPANEDKPGTWFLQEAHKLTRADLGITNKPAAPEAPKAPKAPPAPRGVDKSTLPPTLTRVPPSAEATIAGDEFAHLNGLKGFDRERAFAKMTAEQMERYLN